MITLYHCLGARSFRALWMLEELGLPYTLKVLPFPPRAHARPYLDENPLGTVPLMIDGATRMTESAAICQYLAVRAARIAPTPLQVTPDEPDFGAWLNALHFGEATLTFPQTLMLRYTHFEPPERRQPQVVEDYTRWVLARMRPLEAVLAQQEWLCAGRFTAADVSVGYALMLGQHLGLAPRFSPALAAYWARQQARNGYRRALAAEQAAALAQGVSITSAPEARPWGA